MDGDAPLPFVSLGLLATTGAIFDETTFNDAAIPRTSRPSQLTPCVPYGLRHPYFDPTLAPTPSPPASPTRLRLDPTARPFSPKHGPSHLKVETNVQQEHGAASPTTPRTPRIQLSPAEDVGAAGSEAVQAVRQLSKGRRQSSPGRRPTGIQRQSSGFGRKQSISRTTVSHSVVERQATPGAQDGTAITQRKMTATMSGTQTHDAQVLDQAAREMPPPPTPVLMSRGASAPGTCAAPSSIPWSPQTPLQRSINPFLAPVQPINPANWLTSTHNVGYDAQLSTPRTPWDTPSEAPTPATPLSTSGRSRASSNQSRTPLVCEFPGCRHRAQGKTFKTPGDRRKHERTHLPESDRPHACVVLGCGRRFLWPKDVERHIRVVHDRERVVCSLCGAELCRGDDLARHVATVHNGQAPSPRNWVARSPSASSVASYAVTPGSEFSYAAPGTPMTPMTAMSSFGSASASRPRVFHNPSFGSIPEDGDDVPRSVPMVKSLTK